MLEKRGVSIRHKMAELPGFEEDPALANASPDDPRVMKEFFQLAKEMKGRKTPFTAYSEAIEWLANNKYKGATEKFSTDLLGSESTLQGSSEMIMREMGHVFEGGYGVGLGPKDRVGHPLGSWVKIEAPNGKKLFPNL
jgi:hypothetical protein